MTDLEFVRDRRLILLIAGTLAFFVACYAPRPQLVAVLLGFASGLCIGQAAGGSAAAGGQK